MQHNHASDGDQDRLDLLWGVRAIAADIGRSERSTYHLLEKKLLPAQKYGGKWVASRQGLRAHFSKVLAGA